ncbi:SDR family NAD(P)-dependent oxidoreductase [Rhodococcus erythropolis]|uniref:type I polyketide synthase n=1 Tax=Rhodococcus erythropolis TaxID=1833 RepID=UPI001F2C92A5|nr:type I polyketide synthase [Rhodococcus erythropolis]UJC76573.1 SDR family NAD(P)-dependent oxidoreductase [Rhodococcus erythropolis]
MTEDSTNPAIAIVGMSMWSPGAHDLQGFWENVLARRMQFRKFPESRMSLDDYWSASPDDVDKTYADRGAFMDGFEFDWVGRRIPERTFKSTDLTHWLALETALGALTDAGYSRGSVPTGRSAAIVGNSLTGEESRMWSMRLRWPYVKRALAVAAEARQLDPSVVDALAETMEEVYKGPLVEPSEDTLAGMLSNTIAGRICNYLDFNGGGYVVDGACASGMLAVATAAEKLASGAADFVLAGGVDVSLDPLELVGFARLGALTRGDMNVYDASRSGFIPGEGCGFVALKRLEDARADGDYVYATIRGWGISTDGKGGITKPRAETQAEMIRRAYSGAGFASGEVAFVEGHGTGTPVGDPVELAGVQQAAQTDGPVEARSIGMTSLKSLIGHTKAASGILALIKATMAVNQRILPPLAGCTDPNPAFLTEAPALFPLVNGEVRDPAEKMRAGAQAMGFGGINCHVAIESADAPSSKLTPSRDVRTMMASYQDTEVFVLSADSAVDLATRARDVADLAVPLSVAELLDFSAKLSRVISPTAPFRAAVVAGRPAQLAERMRQLAVICENSAPASGQVKVVSNEISISNNVRNDIGFLFPGQGSQQLEMARVLIERFEWARELAAKADGWLEGVGAEAITPRILRNPVKSADAAELAKWKLDLAQTQFTQPAVALASLLWFEYLRRLGVTPSAVAGHSLGELTALYAAGAYDQKTLITLAAAKGAAMSVSGGGNGAMAGLTCDRSTAEAIIAEAKGYATVANLNTPTQTVVSGTKDAVDAVVAIAKTRGVSAQALAVSNAFHSEMMNEAERELKSTAPVDEQVDSLTCTVYSCVEGERVQTPLALRELVTKQVVSPVDWVKTVSGISQEVDLLVEVGPGRVLTGLTKAINGTDGVRCFPVASKSGRDEDFNVALAAMYVHGAQVRWNELFDGRFVREFVPADQKVFIENLAEAKLSVTSAPEPLELGTSGGDPAAALADYLSRRGTFLVDVIRADVGSGVSAPSSPIPQAVTNGHESAAVKATAPAPVPVVEVPAVVGATSVEGELIRILADTTGFPAESITTDLRLLDDLNLDSISAAEAISKVAHQFEVVDLDPAELANATIGEAASLILAVSPNPGSAVPATRSVQSDVSRILLEVIAEDTGFPVESLDVDLHLLDDLNMDSIKAADAIATVATRLGVQGDLDPAELVNVSLGELIEVLDRSAKEKSGQQQPAARALPAKAKGMSADSFTWVRDYTLEKVRSETALHGVRDLTDTTFVVIGDDAGLVGRLESELRGRGARVDIRTFSDSAPAHAHHVVAVMPRVTDDSVTELGLRRGIEHMYKIVPAQQRGGARTTLAVVQFIDVELGNPAPVPSAAAFAASVHHERPELDVRVIGFDGSTADAEVAATVVSELDSVAPYVFATYDAEMGRTALQPKVLTSSDYTVRESGLGSSDVVVVTGGAKGIMAQCALALGRKTGAELVLIGSSQRQAGDEIASTLADFTSAGLSAHYYRCNVTDAAAVAGIVAQIEVEVGPITGFVHGAGANVPRRFERVDSAAAFTEVAPKVLGAANFVEALADRDLKLFVGFSSIIGFTGMPGNSWYAYGNELLDDMVARYAAGHPRTRTFSLAYSVWGETGMGARMGSVNHLAKMGVMPISTSAGVDHFLRLVDSGPEASRIVVTSRLGGLDTWAPAAPALPAVSRYIDQVVTFEPQVELVTRTTLSTSADPFVLDHVWKGSALLPTVFGLEAMSQAAAYVTGRVTLGRVRIDDIKLDRPIVVDTAEGTGVEIKASVVEQDRDAAGTRVHVTIGTERTGYGRPHFSADFIFGLDETLPEFEKELPRPVLDIDPLDDLYSWLLFQEGDFRRLEEISSLDSEHILFSAISRADRKQHLLGDPYFLDSLLQSGQIMVPREICLPVNIARIDMYDGRFEARSFTAYAYDKVQTEAHMQADVAVVKDGRVVMQLEGYRSQILSHDESRPTAEEIADPTARDAQIILDKLAQHSRALGVKSPRVVVAHTPGIHELTKSERHEQEKPIAEAAVNIHLDEDAVIK